MIAAALSKLETRVKNQVKAAVLFGYSRNDQNYESIKGYPKSRTKIFCHEKDKICHGSLNVTLYHLNYKSEARREAAPFLFSQIDSA